MQIGLQRFLADTSAVSIASSVCIVEPDRQSLLMRNSVTKLALTPRPLILCEAVGECMTLLLGKRPKFISQRDWVFVYMRSSDTLFQSVP